MTRRPTPRHAGLLLLWAAAAQAAPPPETTPAAQAEPPAIDVNQLGYAPDSSRRAILRSGAPAQGRAQAPAAWTLVAADGRLVRSGTTRPLGFDAASGFHLQAIDFDGPLPGGPGYRLKVGEIESRPFAIAPGLLQPVARDALHYFYHNRSGVPIEARLVGSQWARPAGHPRELVSCFAGRDAAGNDWPGCSYTLDATGGWYDAGDHGKYVVNGGISVWTLLNLFEIRPDAFPDRSMAIPEAGNGASDLLDEARYQMEFLLRMQVPDGATIALPVSQPDGRRPLQFSPVDAGGMAHLKIADVRWTALPLRPDKDPEPRFLYPPSTSATLNLAATAAQCARVWKSIDPAFSQTCLRAARRAWDAAQRNPAIYAAWDFPGSGGYGDTRLSDEFYWAAAELLATTGEARFLDAVRASPHFGQLADAPNWQAVAPLGTLTLALSPTALPPPERKKMVAAVSAAADRFQSEIARSGYGIPFAGADYVWGSNGELLNRALVLGTAHHLGGNPAHRAAMADVLDYLLGRNPIGVSYISGHGTRAMQAPHHRFWAASLDPAFPPPPPGAVSGGPNSSGPADPVAQEIAGRCAPQRCWKDDARAFSLNEVAINWNAPLVWAAAYLAETGPRP